MSDVRPAIIRLFQSGKGVSDISRLLRIPKQTVSYAEPLWCPSLDISARRGAPSHRAIATQKWIAENFPYSVTVDISPKRPHGDWPSKSPDLNPLDILQTKACAKPHDSIESLKRDLRKAWNEIPMETIAKVVDDFPKRLRKCIYAKGGHFEP